MIMATIKQPGFAPTNKLTAAMLAGVAYEFLQPLVDAGITWLGAALGVAWQLGPNGDMVLMFATMMLAGYLVKDRPNI